MARSMKLTHINPNEWQFHQTTFLLSKEENKRWEYFVEHNLISSYESELLRLAIAEFLLKLNQDPTDFNQFLIQFHGKYRRDHHLNIQHPELSREPQIIPNE